MHQPMGDTCLVLVVYAENSCTKGRAKFVQTFPVKRYFLLGVGNYQFLASRRQISSHGDHRAVLCVGLAIGNGRARGVRNGHGQIAYGSEFLA